MRVSVGGEEVGRRGRGKKGWGDLICTRRDALKVVLRVLEGAGGRRMGRGKIG